MEQQEKQIEIDLMGLLNYLKKRIIIIVAAVLVFAVAGLLYSAMFTTPTYVAETRLYILNRSSTTSVNGSDYQTSTYMLHDYQVLVTGKNVTKEVVNQLGLQMSPEALSSKVSVSAPEETRVLQIKVTDTDPQLAADIANKVCQVAIQELKRLTDADAVHQVYEADVPKVSVGASMKKCVMLAAALGFLASAGVLTVLFILDDTLRTEEDVERYLGLGVLGVIPDCREIDTALAEKQTVSKRVDKK